MKGKVIAITGSNVGIGKATAEALAKKGAKIVLLCRNAEKGRTAQADIIQSAQNPNIGLILLDLSSFDSIRQAAEEFKSKYDRLDILINNAGFYAAGPRAETQDGFESTFGVNHLGHFLLTEQLMPAIKAAPKARLIHVSSGAHEMGTLDWEDLNAKQKFNSFRAYSQSKMCNILFSNELAQRFQAKGLPITSNSLHPGVVRSNFAMNVGGLMKILIRLSRPFFLSNEKGAATSIHLASSPEVEGITGKYWEKSKQVIPNKFALDTGNMEKLWKASEEMCNINFNV